MTKAERGGSHAPPGAAPAAGFLLQSQKSHQSHSQKHPFTSSPPNPKGTSLLTPQEIPPRCAPETPLEPQPTPDNPALIRVISTHSPWG